jgi:uncharacterized protein (DUF433 family)
MSVTRDEDVLGGEPRIDGTRIGVRHITERVIDTGQSPAHVADQFDIPLADVYEALSYYILISTKCANSNRKTGRRLTESGKPR